MKELNTLYWLKQEKKQIENQIKELTVLSAVAMSGMPSSKKGGLESESISCL